MSDCLLIDGDQVLFDPTFAPAVVITQPGRLPGSGSVTVGGRKLCVQGDETQVEVPGCLYTTAQYSVPGSGTLKIAALASNQQARHTFSGGKPVLLKGGNFTAQFEVQAPAQQPTASGPVPDGTPFYSGQGWFITTNLTRLGT